MKNNHAEILRYLIEFRRRLINCVLVLAVIFAVLFYFANAIYTFLALPLLKHLPSGHGLIATNIVAPLFVPFELSLSAALFFSVPFFLYQFWAFISPALYPEERKIAWPLLMMSIVLFYAGVAFAYWVVFPLLFGFLTHVAPQGVMVSPDISQYLDFILKFFGIFGTIFEVPIITVALVWARIITREKLIKMRPYAIVTAFVIGMLLAPPDVISQTVVAVPLWLLFEAGIFFSRFITSEATLRLNQEK